MYFNYFVLSEEHEYNVERGIVVYVLHAKELQDIKHVDCTSEIFNFPLKILYHLRNVHRLKFYNWK